MHGCPANDYISQPPLQPSGALRTSADQWDVIRSDMAHSHICSLQKNMDGFLWSFSFLPLMGWELMRTEAAILDLKSEAAL